MSEEQHPSSSSSGPSIKILQHQGPVRIIKQGDDRRSLPETDLITVFPPQAYAHLNIHAFLSFSSVF